MALTPKVSVKKGTLIVPLPNWGVALNSGLLARSERTRGSDRPWRSFIS